MNRWICSQFGGREKYAIPRALSLHNELAVLYTDIFIRPGTLAASLLKRSKSRYHPDLSEANVVDFNTNFFVTKLRERLFKTKIEEDQVYDELVASKLSQGDPDAGIFFGYSYSSRRSMKVAKQKGLRTILGQINPGPAEADIVIEEYRKFKGGNYEPFVPDNAYWDLWREEISNADDIIVNSQWSSDLLKSAGVDPAKLKIIPLAYEETVASFERVFPMRFDSKRPLRLLFLGGLEIRKGVHILIEAMRSMTSLPVTLDLVGSLKSPAALLEDLPPNVIHHGPVTAVETAKFYQSSDLFVFPTLSDGFGLTLLEAQARKLPVLSSIYCAPIVSNNVNGLVIDTVTTATITNAIHRVLDEPQLLQKFSVNSVSMEDYSINRLFDRLKYLTT